MRSFLLLVLLSASLPAMANNSASSSANPTQGNDNTAASQSMASQQNQSRSESIGGNMINNQYNTVQGELGEMTVSERAVSCESGSFYVSAGAYPQDSQGFYTFDDRDREMMYAPQANLGFQLPFGPQVAACVEAMKRQTEQIQVGTESGIFKTCVSTKINATKAEIALESLAKQFPQLTERCSTVWGITSNSDPVAQVGKP
jgi:hypothetical protein